MTQWERIAVQVVALMWSTAFAASPQNQCSIKDGQCTYNINLAPSCSPPAPVAGPGIQQEVKLSAEGFRKDDYGDHENDKMNQMQQDFNIVKADHENRIKELENSIQKVLRNAIPTSEHSLRRIQYTNRPQETRAASGGRSQPEEPSENILLIRLQTQFNKLRSSLTVRTADLLETKNKLNETTDLLTEAQRQLFEASSKLGDIEQKAVILERESRIIKNKLRIKTDKLDYVSEKLNSSESKLASVETQLYDVVRSESTLKEESLTLKMKMEQMTQEMEQLQRNHTTLHKRYHRTKKTLQLREEELMECYTAKTQTFCGFEDPDLCGFTQETLNDTFDWERIKGRTPSANTGPEVDHTCKHRNGHFMYIEASGKSRGQTARLLSPKYRGLEPQCVQFYYHMSGRHTGTLAVNSKPLESDEEETVWKVYGNQGNLWIKASISVDEETATSGYQLIFEATTEVGYEGDISIDDFRIKDGACHSQSGASRGTPAPLTQEQSSQKLKERLDRYRKLLRRRQRQRQKLAQKAQQPS